MFNVSVPMVLCILNISALYVDWLTSCNLCKTHIRVPRHVFIASAFRIKTDHFKMQVTRQTEKRESGRKKKNTKNKQKALACCQGNSAAVRLKKTTPCDWLTERGAEMG